MLNNKSIINTESFTLFDSAQLADTINHDIENIPIAHLCLATHNYDIMFIEKVLNAIELQADIDRFAALLKIRWKIDVSNNRMEVVKLNTETKLYEPYHPQFENDVVKANINCLITGQITALNNDKYNIMRQRNWRCDIEPARRELGYQPQVKLQEGVRRSIAWYKENKWL